MCASVYCGLAQTFAQTFARSLARSLAQTLDCLLACKTIALSVGGEPFSSCMQIVYKSARLSPASVHFFLFGWLIYIIVCENKIIFAIEAINLFWLEWTLFHVESFSALGEHLLPSLALATTPYPCMREGAETRLFVV